MVPIQDLTAQSSPDDASSVTADRGGKLSAFASPRRSIWGYGESLRIEVPAPWPEHLSEVTEALNSIDTTDGLRPIALGSMPYDTRQPATFTVPRTLHMHGPEGHREVIEVSGNDDRPELGAKAHEPPGKRQPAEITISAGRSAQEWLDSVDTATKRIAAGELTKVVLAREIRLQSDVEFNDAQLWNVLNTLYPTSYRFAVDGFVGASPELLVSRIASTVRAQPMAGTTPRTGDTERDQRRAGELLASEKNQREHRITIDSVIDALLGSCSYLDSEPTPSIVAAGPVQHLASLVEGRLSSPEASILDLVAALHPTPAVGGHPTQIALQVQSELEDVPRGRYAGPVGWVDSAGDGAFAVGIRSVQLAGREAQLFAGVGVVEDSDPAAEFAETQSKAQAILSALVSV